MALSPLARRGLTANSCFMTPFPPQLLFPVIGGKDVVVWEEKPQKLETDLSEIMEALVTTRSCCLLSEHYNRSRIGSSCLANQKRFITNNNNNNNMKLKKKKKKNDWLLSSSNSLNSPNFTVQPLQLDVFPETLEPSLQLAAAVLAQAKLPTSEEIAATIDEFKSRHLSELTELCEVSGSCLGYGYSRLMSKLVEVVLVRAYW